MMIDVNRISYVLSHPTWDVLVLFFFIAAGFFYGLSFGRVRMIAVLLSVYVSQLLFLNIGFMNFFLSGRSLLETFLIKMAVFLALVAILSHLFMKTFLRGAPEPPKAWWEVFLFSFLEVGLIIASIFALLPAAKLFKFSPAVNYLFVSPDALFWWLVLPLAALFIIMRKS